MKTLILPGKWLLAGSAIALLVLAGKTASAQSQTGKLRIGVYDSRVVAVAYGNSTEFRDTMKPITADYEKAKASRDEKRVKEVESRMKSNQRRAHEQAFSTGSVTSVMAKVKKSLPDVAKQAGVKVIVSKWEVNYQSSDVELVDVTDRIVALFHVNEQGLKWTKGIQEKPPVPIDDITDDME